MTATNDVIVSVGAVCVVTTRDAVAIELLMLVTVVGRVWTWVSVRQVVVALMPRYDGQKAEAKASSSHLLAAAVIC